MASSIAYNTDNSISDQSFVCTVKWLNMVKVDLGVTAMKGYSTFPKAPDVSLSEVV